GFVTALFPAYGLPRAAGRGLLCLAPAPATLALARRDRLRGLSSAPFHSSAGLRGRGDPRRRAGSVPGPAALDAVAGSPLRRLLDRTRGDRHPAAICPALESARQRSSQACRKCTDRARSRFLLARSA